MLLRLTPDLKRVFTLPWRPLRSSLLAGAIRFSWAHAPSWKMERYVTVIKRGASSMEGERTVADAERQAKRPRTTTTTSGSAGTSGRRPQAAAITLTPGCWTQLDGHGSRVGYWPVAFGRAEAAQLAERLTKEVPWQQREIVIVGKRVMQPRLIAYYADSADPALAYTYSGGFGCCCAAAPPQRAPSSSSVDRALLRCTLLLLLYSPPQSAHHRPWSAPPCCPTWPLLGGAAKSGTPAQPCGSSDSKAETALPVRLTAPHAATVAAAVASSSCSSRRRAPAAAALHPAAAGHQSRR